MPAAILAIAIIIVAVVAVVVAVRMPAIPIPVMTAALVEIVVSIPFAIGGLFGHHVALDRWLGVGHCRRG